MNHLNRTGLIHACQRGPKGQLQIPYSIALRLAAGNEKALSVPVKYSRPRRKQEKLTESLFEKPQKPAFPRRKRQLPSPDKTREGEDRFDYYRKIGESLAKLGITPEDLLKFYGLEASNESQKTDNPS